MKKRWPFLVVGIILIAGFILGSFFDHDVAKALFSNRNTFGITVTAFGLILAYGFFSMLGGMLFKITLVSNQKKWLKIVLYILSFACIISAIYFSQKHIFIADGFNKSGFKYVLMAICFSIIVHAGFAMVGVLIGRINKNEHSWKIIVILTVAAFIALVPLVQIIKLVEVRPRYRLVQTGLIEFYPWWRSCLNYKDYLTSTITREEFKSFPSGHAAAAMLVCMALTYIPVLIPNISKKWQIPFFFIGWAYALFVSYARVLVGAHYLSDVSMGMLITLILFFVGNEIIVRKNYINQ